MVNKDLIHLLQMRRRVVLKRIQYFIKRNIQAWTHEERMIINEGPRVLANSTPKAGTNLLLNALQAMPNTVDRWSYQQQNRSPHCRLCEQSTKGICQGLPGAGQRR